MQYVFYIFSIVFVVQLLFQGLFYTRFVWHKSTVTREAIRPVSVLICAKNEAKNCIDNLPAILSQDYPEFELILINDNSSDNTLLVFKDFAVKYSNIKIVDVKYNERYHGSKKYALSLGIKAAKNEYLLFTDADCKPVSKHWIQSMVNAFEDKALVLAYGAYEKKSNFLNKLIRYETLTTALQYFSYQLVGMPYMGVGRNLAYTKTLFETNNGFYSHLNINSGDDDLFVNEVATKTNTGITIDKKSFTISKPKETLKDWFRQKRRHISTANYYQLKHRILLAMSYISQVLFWLSFVVLLFAQFQLNAVFLLFGIRLVLQYIVIYSTASKLNEKDLIIFSPILEFTLLLLQFVQFLNNIFTKPTHWS